MNKHPCQFCNSQEGDISITDSETLQEVFVCQECDNILFNQTEFTLQEIDRKIDDVIDNQIEDLKLQRI